MTETIILNDAFFENIKLKAKDFNPIELENIISDLNKLNVKKYDLLYTYIHDPNRDDQISSTIYKEPLSGTNKGNLFRNGDTVVEITSKIPIGSFELYLGWKLARKVVFEEDTFSFKLLKDAYLLFEMFNIAEIGLFVYSKTNTDITSKVDVEYGYFPREFYLELKIFLKFYRIPGLALFLLNI